MKTIANYSGEIILAIVPIAMLVIIVIALLTGSIHLVGN
jgi:hypothetical protein